MREALEVAPWDAAFISAKLNRALLGRDHYQSGDNDDDHPVQNDWNGSATLALVFIVRSEPAWRLIACVTGESTPARSRMGSSTLSA